MSNGSARDSLLGSRNNLTCSFFHFEERRSSDEGLMAFRRRQLAPPDRLGVFYKTNSERGGSNRFDAGDSVSACFLRAIECNISRLDQVILVDRT